MIFDFIGWMTTGVVGVALVIFYGGAVVIKVTNWAARTWRDLR